MQPPPRRRRVFTNRNLRLADVHLVGFDMDYTLAVYRQEELDRLTTRLAVERLVAAGYPPGLRGIVPPRGVAARGLFIDRARGNLLKMDRHGHVSRATHGTRPLDHDEIAELYRRSPTLGRFAPIDTLFALAEVALYAAIVDALPDVDPDRLWGEVRVAVDGAHQDGSLKREVLADLSRHFEPDPDLAPTLERLVAAGKRLFLVTNSGWEYTDPVMRHHLGAAWRERFAFVVVGAGKPAFFTERRPFRVVDPASGAVGGDLAGPFAPGGVYTEGSLATFAATAGAEGDHVLYVGDHIDGDVLRPKEASAWRTLFICRELEEEIALADASAAEAGAIHELERRGRDLEAEADLRAALGEPAEELRAQARRAAREAEEREDALERRSNPCFGPLFRDGNETSRFAEQVRDYACIYTSRVSNLLAYSPFRYFRAPRQRMPHEE